MPTFRVEVFVKHDRPTTELVKEARLPEYKHNDEPFFAFVEVEANSNADARAVVKKAMDRAHGDSVARLRVRPLYQVQT